MRRTSIGKRKSLARGRKQLGQAHSRSSCLRTPATQTPAVHRACSSAPHTGPGGAAVVIVERAGGVVEGETLQHAAAHAAGRCEQATWCEQSSPTASLRPTEGGNARRVSVVRLFPGTHANNTTE